MPKARAFFYVCAGIFLLALSYHLGARSATAQAGTAVTGFVVNSNATAFWVMTPNGDVFLRTPDWSGPPTYVANYWGGATPAQLESFGSLKAKYRGER